MIAAPKWVINGDKQMPVKDRVQWVFGAKTNNDLIERYDEWSHSYEEDMLESFGYTAPEHVLSIFKHYVSPAGKVLDSAAGTGLIGQVLYEEGYHDLVALDMSESMLRMARQKSVYRDLIQGVLGERLPLPCDTFDAVWLRLGSSRLDMPLPAAYMNWCGSQSPVAC